MKLSSLSSQSGSIGGNALLATLMTTGLLGFVLASYLTLVQRQYTVTVRSQAWNAAVPVIEAGLEDALTHLNTHGKTNLACDGWTEVSGVYRMQRYVGENFYVAEISNVGGNSRPVISSRGYVPTRLMASSSANYMFANAAAPGEQTYLLRGVRVGTRPNGLFTKAMVARGKIVVSGNVLTDSFDSSTETYSTGGLYDITKSRANGDVASNGQLIKQITTSGSVTVYGHISTGPGGTVGMTGNVSIGSKAWINGGNIGIEAGYFRDDMNVTFPDVEPPFSGGGLPPMPGTVDGKDYVYVLGNGKYELSSIGLAADQEILINGNATLYVRDSISLTGQSKLKIVPGGTLKLYMAGRTASLSGQGVANETGYATNFVYYGLPANTRLDLSGGSGFTGIIYAPQAALKVSGGSVLHGATISDTVAASGGFSFHYDESLASYESAGYVVTSWDEMSPDELGNIIVTMAPPIE